MQFIKITKKISLVTTFLFLILLPEDLNNIEFPTYRVVLDPGHGGVDKSPLELYGDRFDIITKKYLDAYNYGAKYKNLEEHAIAYSIAEKVKHILDLSSPGGDFARLREIIERFTDDNPKRIYILSMLSRNDSRDRLEILKRDDPNAEFRLYDYMNRDRNIVPGRISRINSFKPQLLVSLHMDIKPPVFYRGINPVIIAPYSFLFRGFQHLKGKLDNRRSFYNSHYSNWFVESVKRTGFQWFLKDVSVYFTSYYINKSYRRIDTNRFRGYLYNMVSWRYKDAAGWENIAKKHPQNTQYANSIKNFNLSGQFWKREQSKYESYRREGGTFGYGGDNLFASTEIIRYILFSLYLNGSHHPVQKVGQPYISIWSLPLLVNAITAYIELGYLYEKRFRFLFSKKQDEIAEGIAVGIYSLLTGIKPKRTEFKDHPSGKRIDLQKYYISTVKSYFDIVVE